VSGKANWKCSTALPLGPDKHQRFDWAPQIQAFDSMLTSPALDCLGHAFVTVMYRSEFQYNPSMTPKVPVELGLYILEDTGGAQGPDALDTVHELGSVALQENASASWNAVKISATTGFLQEQTYFGWNVAGQYSNSLNHWDLDDVRVCPGRIPFFVDDGGLGDRAAELGATTIFTFTVKDPDDNAGTQLAFQLAQAPAWLSIAQISWDPTPKVYRVRLQAKPGTAAGVLGPHSVVLRATDLSAQGCLFTEHEFDLWVLVRDGYVVWDPVDPSGQHSAAFANALAASITASGRLVQVVDDITRFTDLSRNRGVFVTLGTHGLDYVLSAVADADAIDLLTDYLAGGGRVYLEGGNTWGDDPATNLHSTYYFPVTGTPGDLAMYHETFPPGEIEGKHFCWQEDFDVSSSALLAFGIDTLQKKLGSSAIPILGDAGGGHEVAVSFESETFDCRTVAASLPFAALVDAGGSGNSYMARIIDFFENGYPNCEFNPQCNDSEVCTLDECIGTDCQNNNEPDCIPCEDDLPCTASAPGKACSVSSGICGTLAGVEHMSTGPAKVISWSAPVSSTITVAATGLVQQVNVKLRMTHNYRGDLELRLSHAGHEAVLKAPNSSDNGKDYFFTYDFGLDSNQMDVFVGGGENGPWTLEIIDHGQPFDGALLGWSLFVVSGAEECTGAGQCTDGNACTLDSCHIPLGQPKGFCVFTADPCNDTDACVYLDHCDPAGAGCVYADVDCSDGKACTVDSCDPISGCSSVLPQHCTNACTSHADCGYDDWCNLTLGNPGFCAPIPHDALAYCANCPLPVPDQGTANSPVVLNDTAHYLADLYVKVHLTHSWIGSLRVTLSDGTTTVVLHDKTGANADDLVRVYELADPAATAGALTALRNVHPDGTWTLSVTDSKAADAGILDYWTLYLIHHDLLGNGLACAHEDMCTSNYCGNGFCCLGLGTGECCGNKTHCVNGGVTYWAGSVCDVEATCQGHRMEAVCANSECVAVPIPDDSGCAGEAATPCADCRPTPICTTAQDQDDPKLRCPDSCGNNDGVCSTGCHCSGTVGTPVGTCVSDFLSGIACLEESDCAASLHCQNGVCCADGQICCTAASQCPDKNGVLDPGKTLFSPPVCGATPPSCQGTRSDKACTLAQCAPLEVQDDSGCGADIVHSYCGFYPTKTCDGTVNQNPACATSCVTDANCDLNAHCTLGKCVGDLEDGQACDTSDGLGDDECLSDHCRHGVCCAMGDCCTSDANCAGLGYGVAPWCHTPLTCQGSRKDAVCLPGFICDTSPAVEDDTACNQLRTDCGAYRPLNTLGQLMCTGAEVQPPDNCPLTCTTDADCVSTAHCKTGPDNIKHCYFKKNDCDPCAGPWDCISGNCDGPAGSLACCATGKDCAAGNDPGLCPASYSEAAVCGTPSLCQGTRVAATSAACACGSATVQDDSACTSLLEATGVPCGCYPSPHCDGAVDQTPACPTSCTLSAECLEGCACISGVCVGKRSNGDICTASEQCISGFCIDGVCCDLGCTGICAACTLAWPAKTVAIDGNYEGGDDFDVRAHRLGTGAGGLYYLLSWDGDWVYVAWQGADLAVSDVLIAFDTDLDPDPTHGASAAWWGVAFPGDRRPEYGIRFSGMNLVYYAAHSGAGWEPEQAPGGTWWNHAGWSGNLTSELRIPRSWLAGFDPDVGGAVWLWARADAGGAILSIWPADGNGIGPAPVNATAAQFVRTGAGQCKAHALNTDLDDECAGTCRACDGLLACAAAQEGTDPDDECDADALDVCGFTGVCGPAAACAFAATSVPCGAQHCEADAQGFVTMEIGPSRCTGTGGCDPTYETPCFPHLCLVDECRTPCTANAHCVQVIPAEAGYYCHDVDLNGPKTGLCEERLDDGAFCDEDMDCRSGFCVEKGDVGAGPLVGVCCATACAGFCDSCITGACEPYADFTDPVDDCGICDVCDGAGACRPVIPPTLQNGQPNPGGDPSGDPDEECAQEGLPIPEDQWVCNSDGQCDGLGACRPWNEYQVCHNSQCLNCKIEKKPDLCGPDPVNGTPGTCIYGGPGDPCDDGLACENTIQCRTACASDAHCCHLSGLQLCRAAEDCQPCSVADPCPSDGAYCCGADSCGDVKTVPVVVGTRIYRTSTAGAADDFSHLGLGVNAGDRVFSLTTGVTPLRLTAAVTGTKKGGGAVDTLMVLRRVDCAAGPVVAYNADCGGNPAAGSCLTVDLAAFTTYYLVVDGQGGPTDKGDLALSATFAYFCGSGTCDPGEQCGVCVDCSPCCGDGACDVVTKGENSCVCAADCSDTVEEDNPCGDGCCSTVDCGALCHADCTNMPVQCGFTKPPVGALESVTHVTGETYQVTGWACDPD
ncbi:MAG: proprotein convertase P-domain-containing protein, partial [Deltaproteobacteria bacterium]|nr:proprotein convertase P-domain-containing protein [Deltaproteobacteria bacterium]